MENVYRGLIKAILVLIILVCGTSLMISLYLTWVFSDTGYPCLLFSSPRVGGVDINR